MCPRYLGRMNRNKTWRLVLGFGRQKTSRRPEGNVALSFLFFLKTKQKGAECREERVFVDSRAAQSG